MAFLLMVLASPFASFPHFSHFIWSSWEVCVWQVSLLSVISTWWIEITRLQLVGAFRHTVPLSFLTEGFQAPGNSWGRFLSGHQGTFRTQESFPWGGLLPRTSSGPLQQARHSPASHSTAHSDGSQKSTTSRKADWHLLLVWNSVNPTDK